MTTLAAFLEREHDDFDTRLQPVGKAVATGDWQTGLTAFNHFRDALETHIDAEERILFPEMARHLDGQEDVIAALHDEHRELRCRLDWIAVALANRDSAGFHRGERGLAAFLRAHGAREKTMLQSLVGERDGLPLATRGRQRR